MYEQDTKLELVKKHCNTANKVVNIFRIITSIREENNPFSAECLKQLKISFIVITITVLFSSSLGAAVIAGVILWCIYSIFEYGAALQMQIDETL